MVVLYPCHNNRDKLPNFLFSSDPMSDSLSKVSPVSVSFTFSSEQIRNRIFCGMGEFPGGDLRVINTWYFLNITGVRPVFFYNTKGE